jgi:hypothetical protein
MTSLWHAGSFPFYSVTRIHTSPSPFNVGCLSMLLSVAQNRKVTVTIRNILSGIWHTARELQMVQLSATRCSCIAVLWVSLVSFASVTLCVASQRVFIVVSVYFVIDSVRIILGTPSLNQLHRYWINIRRFGDSPCLYHRKLKPFWYGLKTRRFGDSLCHQGLVPHGLMLLRYCVLCVWVRKLEALTSLTNVSPFPCQCLVHTDVTHLRSHALLFLTPNSAVRNRESESSMQLFSQIVNTIDDTTNTPNSFFRNLLS